MRLHVTFSLLLLFMRLFIVGNSLSAAVFASPSLDNHNASVFMLSRETLLLSDNQALEQTMGRKLRLGEKIALRLVRKKMAKNPGMDGIAAAEQLKTDGLAIAGFVCGVVSLFVLGIVLGILAIIFSAVALGRIQKSPDTRKGKGFAIAGLILGVIGLGAVLILLAAAG